MCIGGKHVGFVTQEKSVIQPGGETVLVRILGVNGDRVRFGITAPRSVPIHREEVVRRFQKLQKERDARLADAVPQT
jgi:carbon storage regulator